MLKEPSRFDGIAFDTYLAFATLRLGLKPADFWALTFAEWWPLYNAVMGNTIKPMSMDELEDLEGAWINGKT